MAQELEKTAEWYRALLEECHSIIIEKSKNAQLELTEMYLLLGERILQDAKRAPITEIVKEVSRDLHQGERNLWYAVAVVKKYGSEASNLPVEGASVSWTKAKALVAPPPEAEDSERSDPYAVARKLWNRHEPSFCQKLGTELLRLYREKQ